MRHRLINATVVVAIIAVSFNSLAQQAPQEPPAALVEAEAVRTELIAQQIWVPGTVVSRTDSSLASEVPGRITWLADVGDLVEAGDVLAKVDDHMLQLDYEQNQANIAIWEARVNLLSRKQKRFSSMAEQANTSKDQLDEVVAELEIAQQELNQAKVDKRLTEYKLAQSEIKAPFKAMVVERIQSPGEYIAVGQSLLRIVDMANVEASIKAPLSAVPFIQHGLTVMVRSGDKQSSHPIRTIVPVGNSRSRMMEIRVQLQPGDFAIGSAVRVALPHSESHQGLTVPRDALVLRKSGAFVYQVTDNNTAKQIAVKTGIGMGDRIEVVGDINAQSPVITRGAERLSEGQKIRYAEPTQQLANI
ncbi:efflux RND transporter periplasmic adaptor subunit [Aliiglaciecola litoralis]|uniref:Efflux RND transporter periplasmic adaptor subunit n=1 Tax=Aliiglaciecola litoralis TaxID=582857 RepID=A0ABP3WVN6_9ALTE